MGLHRVREDSVKELKNKKTLEELQQENEQLKNKLKEQSQQLDDTMLALCDVYELIVGGDA